MAIVDYPELIPHEREGRTEDPKTKHLSEYYSRLGIWCDACFEEGSKKQTEIPEFKEISLAIDYLAGMQWRESMPSYRARPVSNEFFSLFWECVGLLTDIKPLFHISDMGRSGEYSNIQKILNGIARGWAEVTRFEKKLAMATMFGMFTSAPAKVYWNPFARGHSGDPSDGDISFDYLPPSALLRLGSGGEDIQNDECVIYRRMRTLEWIKRAYPKMGKAVRPEEQKGKYAYDNSPAVNVAPNFYPALSGGMKRLLGVERQSTVESVYPEAEVREFWMKDSTTNEGRENIWMGPPDQAWGYWVKPGQKLYPRGRLIVRCNSVTLYDEPNPYYHRKFPFSVLSLYGVPWQQYALSVLSPWMKQQDILNQIMAGVLQCIKKATNPALMASRNAIDPEAMRAIDSSKPNLKVTFSANAPHPPAWAKPPDVPGYVFNGYNIILQSMRKMSGQDVMDAAAGKKQIPGSDTLDRMTFSKTTPIRLMGRNMEDFVDDTGNLWTPTALQFYTAERRVEMLGAAGLDKSDVDDNPGSLIPAGISSEEFVRRWKYKSNKGTLLNVQRQDRVQIAFALRKNHDLSRAGLYRELDWNINQEENDKELQQEAEAVAKAAAAAGIKPGGKGKK